MPHFHDVQHELAGPYRELGALLPDVVASYAALHRASMSDGALSSKTKELIALAIAITRECDGCIASHARGAARRGATVDEVAETVGVTVLMNGGPGTVWGPRALAAFHEWADAPVPPGSGSGEEARGGPAPR